MKKTEKTGIEDLLKLGELAFSTLVGAVREKKTCSFETESAVSREEFEAAFAMIKKFRIVQNSLESRISLIEKEMEKRHSNQVTPKKNKPARK